MWRRQQKLQLLQQQHEGPPQDMGMINDSFSERRGDCVYCPEEKKAEM